MMSWHGGARDHNLLRQTAHFPVTVSNQHCQKHNRDLSESKKNFTEPRRKGWGYRREFDLFLFIYLASCHPITCFVNCLIKPVRAPRPARLGGVRPRASRQPRGATWRPCGGTAGAGQGRPGARPGPASSEFMEYRQRLLPVPPGQAFPSAGRGKHVPAAGGPEPQSDRLSEVLGQKNIFSSSCRARSRHQKRCWCLGVQRELGLFFSREPQPDPSHVLQMWWFPPGADDVDHFTVATAAASENWSQGRPTHLHLCSSRNKT